MNKKRVLVLILALCIIVPNHSVFAQGYTRPNGFVNQSGWEKIHQIKKFQAANNLFVTGGLNNSTTDMLHNPKIGPFDQVKKAPSQGYWIVVNKTKRTLTLYKGRKSIAKYPVALGTKYTPTPSTKATISNMVKNPAWGGMGGKYRPRAANDPYNPLGERWMGLKIPGRNGYGIHGTIRPKEVGTYASNGCIRMFNYDIENYIFPKMKSGDPVWIGTAKELEEWGILQYVDKQKPTPKPEIKKPEKIQKGIDILVF